MLNHPLGDKLKAIWQETKVKRDQFYYSRRASCLDPVPKGEALQLALKSRIGNRVSLAKNKGDLHVFLACSINNWEVILPKTLADYGKLSTFHWPSTGFYDSREEWINARAILNQNMIKAFTEAHKIRRIDVVVAYVSDFNTFPETLKYMASMGAVIFNLCWDDKLYFSGTVKGQQVGVSGLSSSIDLNLTNAPSSLQKYWACGGLALFWPEAADPDICKPHANSDFEYDVLFVGSRYGWRGEFIKQLMDEGVKVQAFGKGWPSGPVSDELMIQLYSKSRIVLGFSSIAYSQKMVCLKGRDFEVPLSGALYLTQHNPELSLVYNVGQEILTYKDYKDCLSIIREVLSNPKKADQIRSAGRTRALRDHTWRKRFDDIFILSGLMAPSRNTENS